MTQDNPCAFPVATIDGDMFPGMTLRDWFAGQALAGLFANQLLTRAASGNRDLVNAAYSAADAMLAERSKP